MVKQSSTDCRVATLLTMTGFYDNHIRIIKMKLWPYVLGAWLVLSGLNSVISLNFKYESTVMGVLALVAGLLVILRK